MSEKRGFVGFLIALLAPFVLVFSGAGLAALGFTNGWNVLTIIGGIVLAAGLIWGLILFLLTDSIF